MKRPSWFRMIAGFRSIRNARTGYAMMKLLMILVSLAVAVLVGASPVGEEADPPFPFEARLLETTPEYRLYRWSFPSPEPPSWPEAGQVVAYYYQPSDWKPGDTPRPGVVCLHILGGDGELTRMIASHFARNGIPAVMPIFPLFGERVPAEGRREVLASPRGARILGEGFRAIPVEVRRVIDLFERRPEVNSGKINLMGTSLGAIMGVPVAGQDERIQKTVFLLGGGNLRKLLENDTPEIQPMKSAIDRASTADREFLSGVLDYIEPLNNVERLRPLAAAGRIRMINAGDDEVVPPAHSRELAEAIGLGGKDFRWIPGRGHYTAIAELPGLLEEMTEFFRDESVPRRESGFAPADAAAIRAFFGGLQKVLNWDPASGRHIRIAGNWSSTTERGGRASGTFELLKGEGERFRVAFSGQGLPVQLPGAGLAMGDDGRVWMTTADGGCFIADSPGDGISGRIKPGVALRRRVLAGFAGMAALSGDLGTLKSIIRLSARHSVDGVTLTTMQKDTRIEFLVSPDGAQLQEMNISAPGRGVLNIMFTAWEPDFPGDRGLFSPPEGVVRREVPEAEVRAAVAAVVNAIFTAAGVR